MNPVLMSPGGYPLPAAEEERLAEVLAFGILGAAGPGGLDGICALARNLFDAPMALVTIIGRDDQRVAAFAGAGLDADRRSNAFCAWTVAGDDPLVVEDALADPRFSANPLVAGDPNIRFYAGAPLLLRPGVALGALCILDTQPRTLEPVEVERLQMLAGLAVAELRSRRNLAELSRRESLIASAAHLTRVGSWDVEVETGAMSWSDEACRILGLPEDASPSQDALVACFPEGEERAWARQALRDLVDHGAPLNREVEMRGPLHERPRWIRILAEADASGEHPRIVGSVQDVTDRREAEARIERLAFRDSLTGLPNRTLFQQTVQSAVEAAARRGGKVGLVLLDLDHFKDVNDSLGHDSGDELLRSVAERLGSAYRQTDMVARLGGDEFAVILPNVNGPDDLTRPTRKVLDLLRSPLKHGGRSLSISASVGAALYPQGADDAVQLLRNADIALFQAKAAGRNRIALYEPEMREAVERRIELLREAREGLERGEFVLHYQPIVNLGPGGALAEVSGFEALTRWNHPTRGLVTPEAFMAAFDDQDLALQFGDFTLDSALRQMREWMDRGIEFGRVAVNVAAPQFRSGRLAETIADKLALWCVPPERLCVEVTENVYMGWGAGAVSDAIGALHRMGVQIALDDFGTGYASLTHLKSFPIDRLKIDRSFVHNEEDRAIVRAVATLGARLGMLVVAEGVEDEATLGFLAEAGCHQAQGFHIGLPMPAEGAVRFLADREARPPMAKPKLRLV